MSCRRRARVPVPRRQTPAGAEDTSSRDSLVIVIRCAQRRPERQPRLHRLLLVSGFVRVFNAQRRPERQPRLHPASRSLVEVFEHAQRRPERQPRLHPWSTGTPLMLFSVDRSTKAGASTPATPGSGSQKSRRRETLNEGWSVNPGDTGPRGSTETALPRPGTRGTANGHAFGEPCNPDGQRRDAQARVDPPMVRPAPALASARHADVRLVAPSRRALVCRPRDEATASRRA